MSTTTAGRQRERVVERGVPTALRVGLFLLTAPVTVAHLLLPPPRGARPPARIAETGRLMDGQLSMTAEPPNMMTVTPNFAGHPFVRPLHR
ncbi:hypothetical protein [Streptomyces katsurahamanus]|uniref:Uncharacterized protein n=1 Tax=Streptomyces katsurahamanus TaxID=2577098 RepID=A0ABW9NNS5_9ACTN|nr:hypothetical protein [Streptomyces katsurahamanus]MQS34699.1 hypothetical protein [Streptomyces katsurahamanus]